MLLPLITLLAMPLMRVKTVDSAPSDKQTLHRLDVTLNPLSDKKAWFAKVERELPPSQIPVWQRLQQQTPANSKHYAELSFILAYYGVDYEANLKRVTRPYQFYSRGYNYFKREYRGDWETEWTGYGETWFALNLLYLKQHDVQPLRLWLEQRLDGCPAEGSDDELGELWKRHQSDMLRAAYGSEVRLNNLAEALAFNYVYESRTAERLLLAQLSCWEHAANPQVAAVARQVYGKVKSEAAHWRREEASWKRNK